MEKISARNPWAWIPTLYFAQGLPYVAVMTLSVIMYKRLGISNTDIALYTGWLYLPWVIKPVWSPFIDIISTKRRWTLMMQWALAASLAGIAFTIPTEMFFQLTLAVFWIVGFTSATHDIAADGFYMLALTGHQQSFYVGIRSTFYRIATVAGQGALVILAGSIETCTGDIPFAWSVAFGVLSVFFLMVSLYHGWALPRPVADSARDSSRSAHDVFREFVDTFRSFFRKKQIWAAVAFMLLYRLPEAQLVKLINPFLLDPVSEGGLGLSTKVVGFVYGTIGIIGLTSGGIVGGIMAARGGLRRWLKPMAWSMSLTCLTFVYLSYATEPSLLTINICVFVEQFGYGFGFTAYMLYLIYFSEGRHRTAHYSICTGFMALGMMLPGMAAGWLQETIGYRYFFIWTIVCCAATIGVCSILKIAPDFGLKKRGTE
ncbi:MAG TPA: MFS transporter [Muribaculaceae bacterium]|jgi:PAT family beta-lactamase induction signal transducer AmpG|nr:MFS transporter [Muribaculaceae bacterium]